MKETGKLAQVTAELRRRNLRVSENRRTRSDRRVINTGETVLQMMTNIMEESPSS